MISRCICFKNLKHIISCQFSTTNILLKNHYDSLGITSKATQTDIKAAYYKLSMVYHPDKNKGENASKKFQDISAAYEVLGNFRLRKLYDKGILHTAGERFSQPEEVVREEHPEEKFYRSRTARHSAPNMSGRTPIYDFDEWSKAHYGTTFEKTNRARVRRVAKMARMDQDRIDVGNEMIIMAVATLVFVFMIISYINEKGYDNVNNRTAKGDRD